MNASPESLRTAVVTGATHGIGYEVSRQLVADGMRLFLHARTEADGQHALDRLVAGGADPARVQVVVADFTRLADVTELAERIAARVPRLDLLVNNAATLGGQRREVTGDGHEQTFQVNYLAHYLLTRMLWPALSAVPGSRVVNLSSSLQLTGHLHWGDLALRARYSPVAAYAQSKLAMTMSAAAVATLSQQTIHAVSVHPGAVATGTMRLAYGPLGASVEDGAQSVLRLCAAQTSVEPGGYYDGSTPRTAAALVADRKSVTRLWKLSGRLCGLDA